MFFNFLSVCVCFFEDGFQNFGYIYAVYRIKDFENVKSYSHCFTFCAVGGGLCQILGTFYLISCCFKSKYLKEPRLFPVYDFNHGIFV